MAGPVRATTPYPGFWDIRQVARVFGVDPAVIRRRLRAEGRSLHVYPQDRRLRLVSEADIAAIFAITPAPKRTPPAPASDG